jgi:hypothetical protein
MIQVSVVAYMASGAFLGLAYFDYIYHLVAITVVTAHLVVQSQPIHVREQKYLPHSANG